MAMTPPEPIPGHHGFVLAVTGVAMVDTAGQAAAALAPLGACPAIGRALVRVDAVPVAFGDLRNRQTIANPEGHRYRVDNAWLTGSAAEVVPARRRAFTELPTPQGFAIWFSMAPLRDLPDMALSLQTDIYVATYVVSTDAGDDDDLQAWTNSAMAAMQPVTAGQYLGDSDLTNRQLQFMSDEAFTRLAEVRRAWDPNGRFVGYLAAPDDVLTTNPWGQQ